MHESIWEFRVWYRTKTTGEYWTKPTPHMLPPAWGFSLWKRSQERKPWGHGGSLVRARPTKAQGLIMVSCQHNARGFTNPLCPCGPSLHPPQGPDMQIPKIVTLLQGDVAGTALIGPLRKPNLNPT